MFLVLRFECLLPLSQNLCQYFSFECDLIESSILLVFTKLHLYEVLLNMIQAVSSLSNINRIQCLSTAASVV